MKVEFELEKKVVLGFMTLMLVGMFSLVAISATQPQAYVEGGQGLVSHAASDISGSINADTIDGMHAADLIGAGGSSGTNYVQTFWGVNACPTGWQTAVTGIGYSTSREFAHGSVMLCGGDERRPRVNGEHYGSGHESFWYLPMTMYKNRQSYMECAVCYR